MHADKLLSQLEQSASEAQRRGLEPADPTPLTFELTREAEDLIGSLERLRSGIHLLSAIEGPNGIRATVRVPDGKRSIVEAVFNRYKTETNTKSGRPKHQDLVENIESIRLATEADLWTDSLAFPQPAETLWWEVWLYVGANDHAAVKQQFADEAASARLEVNPRMLVFPERAIVLVWGSHEQWQRHARLFLHVAELRRAKPLNSEYVESSPRFQRELIDDLVDRVVRPSPHAPAVCLLDTGVAHGHPLLALGLEPNDAQAVELSWGARDHHAGRHGTTMAGLALYGSLVDALQSSELVTLEHRLESVKILPPNGENRLEVYGSVTQEAIARIESLQPQRRRVFNLAVTADCRDGGLPSSWSAAVDQTCVGGALAGEPKLICVAAGNLRDQIVGDDYEYPMLRDSSCGVEDPGQSWNALTVGAMTERVDVGPDPAYADYTPIAMPGDLCPTSRVSLAWPEAARDGWPVKPDVVMEGGNWAVGPGQERCVPDDLGLLTTTLRPGGALLSITHDTSPATALAARMAARIWARYPDLRAEIVRGLMVHSARWTSAMRRRFPGTSKAMIQDRLRCYGYGVPDEARALRSAENLVTLIYEGALTPYCRDEKSKTIKTKEMHVHELPWPTATLQQLGHERVQLRITLSYFVEPSPGRRGWTRRHRYASHGLRFAVFRPTDTEPRFLKRVSTSALDETEADDPGSNGDDLAWVVGPQKRGQGSIHSDWCDATAAELAVCNKIAVYPVTGWWRERKHLERWGESARYSLIVTLETARNDVQLYSEIKSAIRIPSEVTAR
ncbi:S8 family peptidase [Enhygromyxa salina]|uniref:S8 family peptidase n=1 Tax=Enhygromyxa salina TaxID=215803 RepID=UPI0015E7665A|nr:S8 family peptidase [Enhygromyxa salina]